MAKTQTVTIKLDFDTTAFEEMLSRLGKASDGFTNALNAFNAQLAAPGGEKLLDQMRQYAESESVQHV